MHQPQATSTPQRPSTSTARERITFDDRDHFQEFDKNDKPKETARHTRSEGPAANIPNVQRTTLESSSQLRREMERVLRDHEKRQEKGGD